MSFREITASPAWGAAGWTMLHLIWVGVVLGAIGAALRRLLRKSAPETRYGAAVVLLALMSAAPVLLFGWLYEPARPPSPSAAPTAVDVAARTIPQQASLSVAAPIRRLQIATMSPPGSGAKAAYSRLEVVVNGLPALWLAGSSLTVLLLATGLWGTRALRSESLVLGDGEVQAMALRLAESLGVARRFGVAVCEKLASPVLLGIARPLILLPPSALSGWTVDELEMALVHELAHLRRHDNLVNLWQCAVESLLFFHPVTWWLSAWVRLERERCCDRVVVGQTGKSRPYAEMLASLAGVSTRRGAVSALAERPVVVRIRTILNMEEEPMRLTLPEGFGLVGAALLAGALALGAYAGSGPMPGAESTNETRREALKALAQKADDVAVDSPEFDGRGDALLEIARAQLRLGDREAARDTMRRAEQAARSGAHRAKSPPSFAAFATKARVAEAWKALGEIDSARAALDRATKDLEAMLDPGNRALVAKAAGLGAEEAGTVGFVVAELATPIIEQRIQLGDLDEARRLIAWSLQACEGVKGLMRPILTSAFASLSARAGGAQQARSLVLRAEQEARALPATERARVRRFAARTLAECGELDQAVAILEEQDLAGREKAATEILEAFWEQDPDELAAWLDPAGIKVLIGTRGTKPKGPPGALRELAARLRKIDDPKVEARSLSTIALLLAKAGEPLAALEVAESIPAFSRTDDPGPSDGFYDAVKPGTFAMIAARMAKAGDKAGAAGAFGRSAALARAIGSPGERLVALVVLADAYADAGDRAATVAVVREAAEVARPLPEPRRSRALVMLVRAQANAGDPAGAVPLVDSLRAYPGVEKAQALVGLARAFEKAGDAASARSMASRALECAKAEKPDGFKLGPATNVNAISRDTFLDPDLEFEEPFIRFHLAQITESAQNLLNVTEAERAAKAKPVLKRKGVLGGRNMALGTLANDLAAKGKLGEALRIVDSIEEPQDKLWAYEMMARAIRDGGAD